MIFVRYFYEWNAVKLCDQAAIKIWLRTVLLHIIRDIINVKES